MPQNKKSSKLLSGGNPQISKGEGDQPVQAYIEAMPDWKRAVGERIDALVTANVPELVKAVKWNSPMYGVRGLGWFLSMHCTKKYVKVAFFNGAALQPPPPVDSKNENVRYLHVHEADEIDQAQFAAWVQAASQREGWLTGDIA